MIEVLLGTGLFTSIVFLLALLVLVARFALLPRGTVTVVINDTRELKVPAGGKLLGALQANDLIIPSPCGGNGSCGQCRVNVLEGGGELLPIESSFISKREAAQGQRLACQVLMQADSIVRLRLPEGIFGAHKLQCTVSVSRNVATYIREIVLVLPEDEDLVFPAGSYVTVDCPPQKLKLSDIELAPEYRAEWERFGLLQMESIVTETVSRAYSIANYPGEPGSVLLNIRLATPPPAAPDGTPPGKVSSYLFSLKQQDEVAIAGPFGDFFVKDTDAEMIFVGGGAGMAPLRSHVFDQLKRVGTSRKISYWYGARSLQEAFYSEQFAQLDQEHDNFGWHLALSDPKPEDNWSGLTGFIHEVLFEQYLKHHQAPEDCEYYLCGPPLMVAALVGMLEELGVQEQNILFDDFGS